MARRPWVVMSMAVAMTMAGTGQADAQETGNPAQSIDIRVTVRLDNNAAVPDAILRFAKARTTEIYRRIGVHLTWLDAQEVSHAGVVPRFTVVLLSPKGERQKASSDGINDDVIGQALPIARRAYVFYERVMALVSLPDRDIMTLLGLVMAHELGHLMLPHGGHSTTGVMRPNFDGNSRVIPAFTASQAIAVRRGQADEARTW